MDVSPCNPLFDLRLNTQVLSMTLNCSTKVGRVVSEQIKDIKGRYLHPAFSFLDLGSHYGFECNIGMLRLHN
jgi:hypothetical protein